MEVIAEPFAGVKLIQLAVHADGRGHFVETYRRSHYEILGISDFVQDNRSRSRQGVIRGIHYQRQHPQGKLLTVARGRLMDVVVDIRAGSPTFGASFVTELSGSNGRQLYVAPGLAHGICCLSNRVDLLYRCTDYYVAGDAAGIAWDDPDLAIPWPVDAPILSDSDKSWPRLRDVPAHELPTWSPVSGPST